MSDEFAVTAPLGDLIELKRGYDLAKGKRVAGKVPVISSSGETGWHNDPKVGGPGVVTGRYGTIGEVHFVQDDFWPLNTTLYVKDFKGNDPRFIAYFLRTFDFLAHSDKSSVPGINRNHLHATVVVMPRPVEQRPIAQILSALDDKIEVNRRIAKSARHTTRAMYLTWAQDERRKSEQRPLSAIAKFTNGLALQKYPAGDDGGIPVIKIRELNSGVTDATARASADIPHQCRVEAGDLLFSWSGTLVAKRWSGELGALNQHVFKVTSEEFPQWFVQQAILDHLGDFRSIARDKATTMGHIKRSHLDSAEVACPDHAEIERAARYIEPIHELAYSVDRENATLAATRDALLPKLMSGELRVKDAERRVEAVL